jgi:hypothetical protein
MCTTRSTSFTLIESFRWSALSLGRALEVLEPRRPTDRQRSGPGQSREVDAVEPPAGGRARISPVS